MADDEDRRPFSEYAYNGYRCNAHPVFYTGKAVDDDRDLMEKLFRAEGRIDGYDGTSCEAEAEISRDLDMEGNESKYATVVDPMGWTGVHACAMNGFLRLLKKLVENGRVDPLAETTDGMTALSLAQRRGHHHIIDYLNPFYKKRIDAEKRRNKEEAKQRKEEEAKEEADA